MPPPDLTPIPADMPRPRHPGLQRFCLMGFWGVPNFGDEWLFRSAQNILRAHFPDCRITALVLSAETEKRLESTRSAWR